MAVLNEADDVKFGAVQVDALFAGSEKVWPSGVVPSTTNYSGGDVTYWGGFKYHTFYWAGTLQPVVAGEVEYVVVAGGGGGGGGSHVYAQAGGGGGAGGYQSGAATPTVDWAVVVGAGGAGGAVNTGTLAIGGSGSDCSFGTLPVSVGGGGGGSGRFALDGSDGGSGGAGYTPGAGTSGQGFDAGLFVDKTGGGGGGGGSEPGFPALSADDAGAGGDGHTWVDGVDRGGGGGGGLSSEAKVGGAGGTGGGGHGGSELSGPPTTGVPGTGGGGGGGHYSHYDKDSPAAGAAGGSGVVIVRYPWTQPIPPQFSPDDLTGLTLWMDADDGSTVTDDAHGLKLWHDKAGLIPPPNNAFDRVGSTVDLWQWNLLQSPTGRPLVSMSTDFISPLMTHSEDLFNAADGSYTCFLVCRINNNGAFLTVGTPVAAEYVELARRGTLRSRFYAPNGKFGQAIEVDPRDELYVATGVYDAAAGTVESFYNGASDGPTTGASGKLTVGSYRSFLYKSPATDVDTHGEIGEILIYNRVLSAQEVSDVEGHLNQKWLA